ncbi:hypothetical protein [Pantoea sp. S18]|nr:hypothetical protein [Pantoea sp. S18]MEA5101603.1 hypothetical protein [Pantoea sp. S18]
MARRPLLGRRMELLQLPQYMANESRSALIGITPLMATATF